MAVNAPEQPPVYEQAETAIAASAPERPPLQVEDGVIHDARRRHRIRLIRTVLVGMLLLRLRIEILEPPQNKDGQYDG